MAFFVEPNNERSKELGVGHLAHIPVIWTCDWELMEEASKFLIDRGTGKWSPSHRISSEYADRRKLSAGTMRNLGRDLESFLTYCERRSLDWRLLSYEHLLDTYQADMKSGFHLLGGSPLAPGTINRRIGSTCEFLLYCAHHGWRGVFEVAQENVQRSTSSHNHSVAHRRVGKVRKNPAELRLPSRSEIKIWLDAILDGYGGAVGVTAYLMCRMVLETNMRAEEVLLFRADQLQKALSESRSRSDRHGVFVSICFGTKGGRTPGDDTKRGISRRVFFSKEWLNRLDQYSKITRKIALMRRKSDHPNAALPEELFLSPSTGSAYSYQRFREFWIHKGLKVNAMPFEGWTPHGGRHAWACYQMLDRMDEQFDRLSAEGQIMNGKGHKPSLELTVNLSRSLIDTHIRPLMGHISAETPELYLRWIVHQVGAEEYIGKWSTWLDHDGVDE